MFNLGVNKLLFSNICTLIPVAARSKAWVGGRLLPRNAGSDLTAGMDVCLVNVPEVSVRWADYSSRRFFS